MANVEKMSIALTPEMATAGRLWRTANMSAAAQWSAKHCGTGSCGAPCSRRNGRYGDGCGRRGLTAALAASHRLENLFS